GEPEVLGHRQAIVDARHLELDPDPGSRDLVGQETSDVETLEVDRPRGRFELAREEFEERALAGAVGADHAAQFAAPQGEVEGVDGPQPTELLHETPRLQHNVIHRANSGAGGRPLTRRTAPSTAGTRPRGK